jgi:flagella basal body P-ring formation protein FlgA
MLILLCFQVFGLFLVAQGASAAQMLRPQDVETAVRASLATLAPDAEIEVVECSQTQVSGRIEFPLSGAGRPPTFHPERPFLWRGKVISDSGAEYPAWARVRVVTKRKVVRTVADLTAGTVLKPEQLEAMEGLANPLLKQKDEAPSDYAGLCLKRSIPAQTRLSREVVEAPPLVRRGSRVEVEAVAGQTRLKFEAEAHANGRMGDRIELTNLQSGKPFWGVVSGEGSVLIAIR